MRASPAPRQVRASLCAFLLVASHLQADECARIRTSMRGDGAGEGADGKEGAAGTHALTEAVEAMWPRGRFGAAVNTAKRALVNRIGGSIALVCE